MAGIPAVLMSVSCAMIVLVITGAINNMRQYSIRIIKRCIASLLCCVLFTGCASTVAPKTGVSGTYAASADSMEGSYTVSITLQDSSIQDVTVDASFPESLAEEFKELGISATAEMAERIKTAGSPDVDFISRATVTCQAVQDAAGLALKEAGVLNASDYSAKDGTYQSVIFGNNDLITVSVELKDQTIQNVAILSQNETPGVGGPLASKSYRGFESPVEVLPERIRESQSVNVDMISGATVTSYCVVTAVKECLSQAGSLSCFYFDEPEHKAYEAESADIIVAGGGGAGLAAAIHAAELGNSVLILETNDMLGGDTMVCGAIYNAPDEQLQKSLLMNDAEAAAVEAALAYTTEDESKQQDLAELQNTVREQWDAFRIQNRSGVFDSKEFFALQTWIGGDLKADYALVRTLADNAGDGLSWLESLGVEFDPSVSQGAGSLWPRTHTSSLPMGTGFMRAYAAALDSFGDQITILTGMSVSSLIKEEGRITGVRAVSNHTGEEVTFSADKGVILATGGFSANPVMVSDYNTSGKWPDLSSLSTTNRFRCSQGDGILLALEAGARLTDMDQIQLLYLGNTSDGQLTRYPPRDVSGTDQIIFVNAEGKRFVREDGRRDEISLAILQQKDQIVYMIESADGDSYEDIFSPSWRSADGFTFDYLLQNGYALRLEKSTEEPRA